MPNTAITITCHARHWVRRALERACITEYAVPSTQFSVYRDAWPANQIPQCEKHCDRACSDTRRRQNLIHRPKNLRGEPAGGLAIVEGASLAQESFSPATRGGRGRGSGKRSIRFFGAAC